MGMAFAEKIKGTGAITCVFIGDGALGEGVVYESFNIAALWRLPILFVIEANGMAQSTPTEHEHAGRLSDRPKAFSILTEEWPVSGPRQVYDRIKSLADAIRQDSKPRCAVLHTFRLGPHSKGDDTREAYLLTAAAKRDPLNLALAQSGGLAITLEERVQATLTQALQQVEAAEGLNPEVYLRMGV
ncbi:MAG: thiamine pyrophosphate-dependent enzyme [Verrucomicrobiota bacterium]